MGKSSVVNILAGAQVAKSSNDAVGCTFDHQQYRIKVASHSIRIYDTTGLNQSPTGTVPGAQAVAKLFNLIRCLTDSDGIDFMVMVIKPEGIKERTVKNYELFFKTLCQQQVPIVIVVTNLENEETMDDWWQRNEERLRNHGMTFTGHACVTTTKGKRTPSGFSLQTEYDLSKKTLDDLISFHCQRDEPWRQNADVWLQSTLVYLRRNFKPTFNTIFGLFKPTPETQMTKALVEHAGLAERDAKVIAKGIARSLEVREV